MGDRIIRLGQSDSMRPDIWLGGFELLESPRRHGWLPVRQGQGDLVKRVLALIVGRAPRTPPNARKVWRRAGSNFGSRRDLRRSGWASCRTTSLAAQDACKAEYRQQRDDRQPIAHCSSPEGTLIALYNPRRARAQALCRWPTPPWSDALTETHSWRDYP